MISMEVFERPDGRFVVRAVGGDMLESESEPFDTRVEAEEWMFNQNARLSASPGTLRPGSGEGPT